MSTMPLARRAAASAAASIDVVEVDRADDQRALGRVGDEGRGELAALGPAVEAAGGVGGALDAAGRGRRARASTGPGRSSSSRVARAGRVVGLLLARVLERGLQREEGGLPAVAGAVELLDPGDRGGAEGGEPEAAVGGEALLRGEVVGVGLGDVERAGRRRPRWRRSGPAPRRRPRGAGRRPSPRSRSRCGPRRSTSAAGSAAGAGASPGSASTTIGSCEERRRGGRLGELRENSP